MFEALVLPVIFAFLIKFNPIILQSRLFFRDILDNEIASSQVSMS